MPTVALLVVLAACGGGAPATQGPAVVNPTQSQPTAAGVATNAAGSTPTSAPINVPTPGSGSLDACSLLTTDEVSDAYGEALDTAEPSSDGLYSYCTYTGEGEVRIFVATSPGTSSTVFNTMKVNDGEAVPGVGDEAYWSTDSFAPGLYFLKGGLLAFISGSQYGPEDPIVQLGVLLASRM